MAAEKDAAAAHGTALLSSSRILSTVYISRRPRPHIVATRLSNTPHLMAVPQGGDMQALLPGLHGEYIISG